MSEVPTRPDVGSMVTSPQCLIFATTLMLTPLSQAQALPTYLGGAGREENSLSSLARLVIANYLQREIFLAVPSSREIYIASVSFLLLTPK